MALFPVMTCVMIYVMTHVRRLLMNEFMSKTEEEKTVEMKGGRCV